MIKLKRLDPDYAVSKQIGTSDVALIHSLGFKSILCVRPDGEDPTQELFEEIETMARYTGLEARYVPLPVGSPAPVIVTAFAEAFAELHKPIFAYDRDGSRAEILYDAMKAATASRAD
jgi:uncharacterized protein (TIGR01244 family)